MAGDTNSAKPSADPEKQLLSTVHKAAVVFIVCCAAASPYFLSKISFLANAKGREKPFASLLIGVIVVILSYYPFSKLFASGETAFAASVVLGLVLAEENISGFHAGFPSMQSTALLFFVFFRSALGGVDSPLLVAD